MTTDQRTASDDKRMRLRYAGVCHLCGGDLRAGEPAIYERGARRVRCIDCETTAGEPTTARVKAEPEAAPEARGSEPGGVAAEEVVAGAAGASARREYERRRDDREKRIRQKHPKLGGLILAISDEPQSTRAWERGAIGEEMLAARLKNLAGPARALHDRRVPGTRANIDHIAITPSGIWVIDAKRYKGKRPELRVDGGIIRPRVESLRIGGRDGTKLVDGVRKQVALVSAALDDAVASDLPVHGVLCFLEADWPLFGGGFSVDGVQVTWPRQLVKRINEAPQTTLDVEAISARIASAFPVA